MADNIADDLEDLLSEVSSVGNGIRRKSSKRGTSWFCDPQNASKLISGLLVAALVLFFVSAMAGGNDKPADGPHLARVEEKPAPVMIPVTEPAVEVIEPQPVPEPAPEEPKEVPVEEPVKEEPKVEEVPVEEPVKEEPKVEETPVEEPAKEEPKVEETPVKEPAKEEPKVEETPAEEPAKEEEPKAEETPPAKEPVKSSSGIPELPWNRDHLPLDPAKKQELIEKWGQWHFWDGDAENRPSPDYLAKYPNRDIPDDQFPDTSWQVDAVYVNHYLNDAEKLINRAMEAIFVEYGHGKPLPPEGLSERIRMFHWEKMDLEKETRAPAAYQKRGNRDNGGWTSKRSFDGLVRRLLHAMITEDSFTVVMGGHSAAAGAGNHFRQSYMMQFHTVMEPIFARLGVKLTTRNMGQGGLGTIQAGMGLAGIYGEDIDLLLWDSGMTENMVQEHIDLYLRQGLIGGNRVPVLWGGNFDLLRNLHNEADADVGEFGNGMLGVETVMNETHALTIPWAARYMKCDNEVQELCSQGRFNATCWVNRTDGVMPKAGQKAHPPSQVKWHPGWRVHQLQGRVLAFSVLEALQVAVNLWGEKTMSGQPLADDYWHVTDYYNNIREKVKNMDPSKGSCHKINGTLPVRMCSSPMKGRTQYTPRADPDTKSITTIMKPAADGYIPKNELKPLYDGPDAHNVAFDVPEGEIDVVAVVMNRRRRLQERHVETPVSRQTSSAEASKALSSRRLEGETIVPGKGWEITAEPEGFCDGTYEAQCNRDTNNDCFLYGQHDARGGVVGTEMSGWIVMDLEGVKDGIIVVKLHTWHWTKENPRAAGWKTVNNERRRLGQTSTNTASDEDEPTWARAYDAELDERRLMRSYSTPELPDTFFFDFAIDGKITSLNKAEFMEQKKQVQRVVETLTLLDDASYTDGKEKNVEVAIRFRGCPDCAFAVTHMYWA